jgi:hypothetical protein
MFDCCAFGCLYVAVGRTLNQSHGGTHLGGSTQGLVPTHKVGGVVVMVVLMTVVKVVVVLVEAI